MGREEVSSQYGGQPGVLHADLDADCAALGGVKASQMTSDEAENVAQRVVAEDYGKGPEEERESAGYKVVVYGRNNTTHDASQADYAHARHQSLQGGEVFALGIRVIKKTTDSNGNNGYDEDVEKHADGINLDNFACRQLHEQGRHYRSE